MGALTGARTDTLRHSRNTIAFTGAAGLGAIGTVTLFTITGRVNIHTLTVFCTEDLVAAGAATLEIGFTGATDSVIAQCTDARTLDANEWLDPSGSALQVAEYAAHGHATDQNVIATVGAFNITDGTIIVDCWWEPITDDGNLV